MTTAELRAQQTQNIYITCIQFLTNVENVEPTLYKCYINVLCLLGVVSIDDATCSVRPLLTRMIIANSRKSCAKFVVPTQH